MSGARELRQAVAEGALRELDAHFADCLCALAPQADPGLLLAAALVSNRTGAGHVCVELAPLAGSALFPGRDGPLHAPELAAWRAALRASGVVGEPGAFAPLILDASDRLYLGRYWHFEARIATRLRELAASPPEQGGAEALAPLLARYFPAADGEPDRQKLAAAVALHKRLAVIAGGPGTGKTTTVTRILALLVESAWPDPPRIALAAPTGKAAARLTESIREAKRALVCPPEVREAIGEEAATLHRLLKVRPDGGGFRHDADNPLHLDVLVVDEASMVDVPLMARLLDALPAHARLILLGDQDQLASVEAGSVLGDICNHRTPVGYSAPFRQQLEAVGAVPPGQQGSASGPLADSLVLLTRSHRFGGDSGIGQLAAAVNRGDAAAAMDICNDPAWPDVGWAELDAPGMGGRVAATALSAYRDCLQCAEPDQALAAFNRFRFLCALREGPFGVAAVNLLVEQALAQAGLIRLGERHYAGRPIMITRNDYQLKLFNGDIGLVLPDPEAGGRLRAFFPVPGAGLRKVLLNRLPQHETVYAMTIHKSQGSEFERCVVVLPDGDVPVLTRELVYTGITRARRSVELWGGAGVLEQAVGRALERSSGLREALWTGAGCRAADSG